MPVNSQDTGGASSPCPSLGLLSAAATLLTTLFFVMGVRALRTPAPLWADGCVLGYVEAIGTGRLYTQEALTHDPYLVLAHPPLSYYLGALFSRMAPLQFWPLRLLTLLATLVVAGLVGATVYHQGDRRVRPALFSGSVFLLLPPVLVGSHLARSVDIMAAGFSVAALLALVRLRAGVGRDVVVGLLFCGAVLSKQTALATLGTTLLACYAMRREWGAAARILGGVAGVLAVVVLLLQWHTQGGFLRNVVSANLMPMRVGSWREMALVGLWPFWLYALVLLAVGGVRLSPAALYFAVSALVGSVACARTGATMMYFTDAAAGLAILSGEAFVSLERKPSLPWTRPAILLIALVICAGRGAPYLAYTGPSYAGEYSRLAGFVRGSVATAGPLMSDDPGLALQLGQTPVWNDGFILGQNARDGRWDCNPLAERLARGEFGAVVTTGRAAWWPGPMRKALAATYTLARQYTMSAGEAYTVYLRATPRGKGARHEVSAPHSR